MPDHQTSPVGEDAERAAPLQYRKKPVVIEAIQWPGTKFESAPPDWFKDAMYAEPGTPGFIMRIGDKIVIETLEGQVWAAPGDWIIRGVKGELYPCKPDIFAATYEVAAPALDASGLPPLSKHLVQIDQSDDEMWGELQDHAWDSDYSGELKLGAPLYTAEQVRQAQRDAYAAGQQFLSESTAAFVAMANKLRDKRDAEIADLRAQLAAARQVGKHLFDAVADGAAPTQPKAQVGRIWDDDQLLELLAQYSDAYQVGPLSRIQRAMDPIVAHIDAWAGSRSTPAAGTVEKDAVIDASEALLEVIDGYAEQLVPINRRSGTVNRLRATIEAHNRAGKEQR